MAISQFDALWQDAVGVTSSVTPELWPSHLVEAAIDPTLAKMTTSLE